MRIIHCNGKVDEELCNKPYAILSRIVARKRQDFFYPFNDATWKIEASNPHFKCAKCNKPLKGQTPIEVVFDE